MQRLTMDDCEVIDLHKIHDTRGNLPPIESGLAIPFEIKRAFYQYNVAGGESHGAHVYIKGRQFLIAVTGVFEVFVDDGINSKVISLNCPYYCFLVPFGILSAEQEFSSGNVCLVLTDNGYDVADYIHNYD